MYKTTNLPVPKMTTKGLRYSNEPGQERSINNLDDFINFALGIIQTVGTSKYPIDRSEYENKTLYNVIDKEEGISDSKLKNAKKELTSIFNAIYKMQEAFRVVGDHTEVNVLLLEDWPSLKKDMVDWWKKYVDPNTKFTETDQDPNLGSVETKSQYYARTGYTRDPEDMFESLLRTYIRNVIIS